MFLGGYDHNVLVSSEFYRAEVFGTGPTLPSPTAEHCMIKINETHSILTGGLYDNIINIKSEVFLCMITNSFVTHLRWEQSFPK